MSLTERQRRLRDFDPRTRKSAIRARVGALSAMEAESWVAGKRQRRADYLRDLLVEAGILTGKQARAASPEDLEQAAARLLDR